MNILRVGLMCRVSTDEQANYGDSLQAQEEALVKFANENNMKINKILTDDADFKYFINEFDIYSANKNMLANEN